MKKTKPINNVIEIKSKIKVPDTVLVADAALEALIRAGDDVNKTIKAQQLAYSLITDQIKERVGDHEVVVTRSGAEIATYKWVKGSEGIDKELLKEKFSLVYKEVLKIGEATRRLILK